MEQDHKTIVVERPTGPRITAEEPKSIGQLVSIRAKTASRSVVSAAVTAAAATVAVLTRHKFASAVGASAVMAVATHLIVATMMMGIITNPSSTAAGGCTNSATFIARTSGLNGTETTAYQNFICGLTTDGIITGNLGSTGCGTTGIEPDGLYIYATNTATTAKLNICGTAYGLTDTGVNFSADHGYTNSGSGATSALNTGYNTSTRGANSCGNGAAACNFIAGSNQASYGAYVLTSRTSSDSTIVSGAYDGTNITQMLPYISTTANALNTTVPYQESSLTNANGMSIITRTAASTGAYYHYNATAQPTITTDSASGTIAANANLFITARNNQGSADSWYLGQVMGAFFGGKLTQANSTLIATRYNNFAKDISGSTINVW